MSLVADYGSSDEDAVYTDSAEEGDQNEESIARSAINCNLLSDSVYGQRPRPLEGNT